jgi:hypothetical protein
MPGFSHLETTIKKSVKSYRFKINQTSSPSLSTSCVITHMVDVQMFLSEGGKKLKT